MEALGICSICGADVFVMDYIWIILLKICYVLIVEKKKRNEGRL